MVSEIRNELFADYSILCQNIKGHPWNILGYKFFEVHDKFQELYVSYLERWMEVPSIIKLLIKLLNVQNRRKTHWNLLKLSLQIKKKS